MAGDTLTENLLRRERWLLLGALAALVLLSWYYLWIGAGTGMDTLRMSSWEFPLPRYRTPTGASWPLSYWAIMLLMWWVMMIAMMLPSAAPMVLLYARVVRFNAGDASVAPPTGLFVTGYLLAWLAFSALATALQWLLEYLGLVHHMMMWSTSHLLSGALLAIVGAYQFSALKTRCLAHCRSPVAYLSAHWRKGPVGALLMGWRHGLFCLGCCWSMMLLLFVGGTMNLVWIAGLTLLVLAEKLLPRGEQVARGAGVLMIVAGGALVALGLT